MSRAVWKSTRTSPCRQSRSITGCGATLAVASESSTWSTLWAAAMLSRAEAGAIGSVAVFLLPGSPAAVELAMRRLIAPELAHIVGQLRGPGGREPAHVR